MFNYTRTQCICIQMAFRTPAKTRLLLARIKEGKRARVLLLCVSGLRERSELMPSAIRLCRLYSNSTTMILFRFNRNREFHYFNFTEIDHGRRRRSFFLLYEKWKGDEEGFPSNETSWRAVSNTFALWQFRKIPTKLARFSSVQCVYERLKRKPGLCRAFRAFETMPVGGFGDFQRWNRENDKGRRKSVEKLMTTF